MFGADQFPVVFGQAICARSGMGRPKVTGAFILVPVGPGMVGDQF